MKTCKKSFLSAHDKARRTARNDNQSLTALKLTQLLPTSTITNIWRPVRRICLLILRLQGLIVSVH